MQKILLAIDIMEPDKQALEFACYLGRLTKSKITGVFLENLIAEERPVLKKVHGMHYVDWGVNENEETYKAKIKLTEKTIHWFKEACTGENVNAIVHKDRGVPIHELIKESRFADILILDPAISFSKKYEGMPTGFVKDILKQTECPVITAPQAFYGIDEIVMAYNGSASSVFAIKQFTYLLPQLSEKKTTIVQVAESNKWQEDERYPLDEWLSSHYTHLSFEVLNGDPDTALFSYLLNKQKTMLVMGAYGRSPMSDFFRRSSADLLVKTLNSPVFIAHL